MKFILTSIIIFISYGSIAQTYSPGDFTPYPIPKVHSDSWYRLDTSQKKSFSVSIVNGRLQIAQYKPTSGNKYILATGELLALNLGEWGGSLYYKPYDTSKKVFFVNGKRVSVDNNTANFGLFMPKNDPAKALIKGKHLLVSPGNTQAVVPYNDGWLFIQGLAHMGVNYGLLSQLTVKKDSFIVSKIFDLKVAPTTMVIYRHKIFIATYNSFYSIKMKKLKQELLLDSLFWEGLYPNSIAVINERNIYIGMHGGYVKLDLTQKDIKFYSYNK